MSFLSIWNSLTFVFELVPAVLLTSWKLEKRKWWGLRFLAVACLAAIVDISMRQMWKGNTLHDSLIHALAAYILVIVLILAAVWCSCRISFKDAIYAGFCGYAMQHFASSLYILCRWGIRGRVELPYWIEEETYLVFLMVYVCVYSVSYRILFRNLAEEGHYNVSFRQSAEIILFVLPVALILSLIEKLLGTDPVGFLICQVFAMLCCFFILWIQFWQRKSIKLQLEMAVQNRLMEERRRQFELSITNIDVINQKCHDLKYQMEALKNTESDRQRKASISEIEHAIEFYDMSMLTGNEVLDTVIMEKSMLCKKWQIQLTCLADGERLGFMNPMDLYVIFGNAIDNAIEAVRMIQETEKRVISLSVFAKGDMTILQIENYYEQEPEFRNRSDNLPSTIKPDREYHGFGLKSIRSTAEKYGGTMSLHIEDKVFILSIVFPGQYD